MAIYSRAMEARQPGDQADRKGTRLGRGWHLARTSWRLTWRDRTVLLLALVVGPCGVAALAAVLFAATGHLAFHRSGYSGLAMAGLLASYPFAFLVVFFDVAMAVAADAKLEGRRIGVRDALRTAHRRGDRIALWAVVVVAASFLLRLAGTDLPDRLGIAAWPLNLLWVLATIFVVPLLALKDAGLREALRESRSLLRCGWGEGLTGLVVIGIWTILMVLPAFFLLLAGASAVVLSPGGSGLVVAGVGLVVLVVVRGLTGALQQVFAVALYRYAAGAST